MRSIALLLAGCMLVSAQRGILSSRAPNVAPPTPPTGNGIIEGTVVNLLTHEPMKKVPVMLWGMASLTAVSDASGHFAFKDLAAGQYTLQVQQPNGPPDRRGMRSLHLGADDHVTDITLTATPQASVAGRVLDQDGSPLPQCHITVLAMSYQRGRKMAQRRASAQTDASGHYEMSGVAPGKYYAMAVCHQQTPLPHPLMERGSPDVPMLRYAPQIYPGSATLAGATRLTVAPGANMSGIDFRMSSARGVALKGRVTGIDPEAVDGRIALMLRPREEVHVLGLDEGTRVDERSGIFRFMNVLPGSYDVVASISGGRQDYFAKAAVEIGSTAPDPVELELEPVPVITGTIQIDGESKFPLQQMNVMLNPLDDQFMGMHPQPNTQPKEDGTFRFAAVPPGHYSLFVNGSAFIQSVQFNDHDVSPSGFEVPAGGGSLKIVLGTKWAEIDGAVSADAGQGAAISGILWRDGGEGETGRSNRGFNADPQGHFKLSGIAPGKYHACALATDQPWILLQNPELLNKLESRCAAVEVGEGDHATVQAPLISSDDLEKLSQ